MNDVDVPQSPSTGERNVDLTVDFGRIALTEGELSGLAVGDVVLPDRPVTEGLEMRVGDRVVARGELVKVEGQYGVRILELLR